MLDRLKHDAAAHGARLTILSITRLQALREELESFGNNEDLNDFQRWIMQHIYAFDAPVADIVIRSVLIVAVPHPPYANAVFRQAGKAYQFPSLIMSDFAGTEQELRAWLAPHGYRIMAAPNLPLKRLAARSGLAVYGRNNICYVEGLGSFFSLAAYFSDLPCEHDDWTDMRQATTCARCTACVKACPTGAIRAHRFLLDNERCLAFLNEQPGEFPDWLPRSAHHCVYDCLACQLACPMNAPYIDTIPAPITFDNDETAMLLAGRAFDDFPPALQEKATILGFRPWLSAIPRNLRAVFELHDEQRASHAIV
jgi:epoxyqueuosine reductase